MPKILIIEDRRENIVFIANNILKPRGFDVITAMDGDMGLKKAQTESPDLIITDLKLPLRNGLEVLEELIEQDIHIPSIVMTFHGTEATAVKALRLGARDYLIKPFTIEEMEEALQRALGSNHKTASPAADPNIQAKVEALETQLKHARTVMTEQERMLKEFHEEASRKVNLSAVYRVEQKAEAWEEDNARLNDILAETKDKLSKYKSRNHALEETLVSQRTQLGKYQKETKRLAEQLRNLSEAFRLMSQDIEHQIERLTILTPRNSK